MNEQRRKMCVCNGKECVSLRNNGKECWCSLNVDKHLKDDEECGTYDRGIEGVWGVEDFNFEYGRIDIDELNEAWEHGDDIGEIVSEYKVVDENFYES